MKLDFINREINLSDCGLSFFHGFEGGVFQKEEEKEGQKVLKKVPSIFSRKNS